MAINNQKKAIKGSKFLDAIVCGKIEKVKDFLAAGCSPDEMNFANKSALAFAAENRHIEIFNLLYEKGAAITGRWTEKAVTMVINCGYGDIFKTLLSQNIDIPKSCVEKAIELAKNNGYEKLLMPLLMNMNVNFKKLLEQAVKEKNAVIVSGVLQCCNALFPAEMTKIFIKAASLCSIAKVKFSLCLSVPDSDINMLEINNIVLINAIERISENKKLRSLELIIAVKNEENNVWERISMSANDFLVETKTDGNEMHCIWHIGSPNIINFENKIVEQNLDLNNNSPEMILNKWKKIRSRTSN